jgi:predicted ABC-type ATPase
MPARASRPPPKPKHPTVVVIAGPNGAGKSTAAPYLLKDALGILEFVNADQIAAGLSAYAPETVAFEAGRIMLQRLRTLAAAKVSFAFESTLSSCKAQGYQVHIYYVALPSAELATQRVALRVKLGGHNIPPDDIARRFQRSLHNLFALYLPLADRWRVLNNATGALTSIARGTAHRTYVEDPDKWLNLQRLGQ